MEGRKAKASERGPAWKSRPLAAGADDSPLSSREERRRLVCAGFCTFFKEQASEEWQCGGFTLVSRLLEGPLRDGAGRSRLRAALEAVREAELPVDFAWDPLLERLICTECAFAPDGGCDHRNPALSPEERLEPCGGYILLAALFRFAPPEVWGVDVPR